MNNYTSKLNNSNSKNNILKSSNELERYLALPSVSSDSLLWWSQYEDKFPVLSKIAQDYLAIQGTKHAALYLKSWIDYEASGHFDNSQIVETKDFSEEAISKTDFIGNDQSYVTKTEMTKILPIGTLGALIGESQWSVIYDEIDIGSPKYDVEYLSSYLACNNMKEKGRMLFGLDESTVKLSQKKIEQENQKKGKTKIIKDLFIQQSRQERMNQQQKEKEIIILDSDDDDYAPVKKFQKVDNFRTPSSLNFMKPLD
ncbi:1695_t:CDS:2 [Entrophospora sp. SA101]|nr:1695_t:CDS:2 [Entrophospora sp. SA101]